MPPQIGTIAPISMRIAAAGFSAALLFPLGFLSNSLITMGWVDPWFGRLHLVHPWMTTTTFFYLIVALPAVCNAGYSMWCGATLGMSLEGTAFRACPAGRIGPVRCFLRVLLGVLLVPLLPVSVAIMLTDRYRRSLADVICGTTVRVTHTRGFRNMGIRSRRRPQPRHDAAGNPLSPPPYCDYCGYPLVGLQNPRCPECGEPFNPALLDS